MRHYRVIWNGKFTRNRGFDIVDAEDEASARREWLNEHSELRAIVRVQEVDEKGDLIDPA